MRTIRGRLLALLLIGLTVVLTAGGAAIYWIAEVSLVRQFDAGLESRAHTLAALVSYESPQIVFGLDDGPPETIAETHYEIRTRSGEVLRRSPRLEEGSWPHPEKLYADHAVFDDVTLPGDTGGRAVWLAFWPRVGDGNHDDDDDDDESALATVAGVPNVLVVVAALDREPVDRALATLLGALVIVGGVLGLTLAAGVTFGVRWGLAPLDRLEQQLGSVDGRTISERFGEDGVPGELAPVYRELNRMLDRVERTIERERSFADAAAHELRTPLTELRTIAEVALRWPDADRAGAALDEVLAVGREMERLVESLLLISRGSAGLAGEAGREIPVATIIRDCLERAAGAISEKRLQLTVDLDERESLHASGAAVEIIVRNLIDNAVRYTPSDGRITIGRDGAAGASPSLVVENDPVQLDEHDLPRLFQPFWRADGSRSDREHVGLGLAVVDQVARAIGLEVDARLRGDRLRICVSAAGNGNGSA